MSETLSFKQQILAGILIQQAVKESPNWDKAMTKVRLIYRGFERRA